MYIHAAFVDGVRSRCRKCVGLITCVSRYCFFFVVEMIGLNDAKDRLSIGHAVAKILNSVMGPGRADHI